MGCDILGCKREVTAFLDDFINSQLGYKEFKGQIYELDKKVFPSKTTEKLMDKI